MTYPPLSGNITAMRNALRTAVCYAWLGFWTPVLWILAGAVWLSDLLLGLILGDPEDY